MIWLCLTVQAADPWKRPEHARVVMQEPLSWKDLEKQQHAHRFWWDETEEFAEIQWLSPKGWKTIHKKAHVGWQSSAFSMGSRFRIKFPSSTRWSDTLRASLWLSPFDLQKMDNRKQCISRITTLAKTQYGLWGASIDGGLFLISDPKLRKFSSWDGLWDDRIISIDGQDDRLLVGSAGGVVLLQEEKVVQSWKEEFASPYIQSVSIQDDDLWIGSYKGLYRIRGGLFESKFRTESVFSISSFVRGETLVGYNGLQYFLASDERLSFSDWGNIYDIAVSKDKNNIWLSSSQLGVIKIQNQQIYKIHKEKPNALYVDDQGLWMADKRGLFHPQQGWQTQFGEVFDLLEYEGDLWFSSETGVYQWGKTSTPYLACSYDEYPKEASLSLNNTGLELHANTSLALGHPPQQEWTKSQQSWHPVSLAGEWKDIVPLDSRIWSLNEEGVWVHNLTKDTHQLMYKRKNLKEIAISSLSVWGRTNEDELIRLTLGKETLLDIPTIVKMSSGKNHICIGTKQGLFRISTKDEKEIWYKKNHFPAVYSTPEGTCWFASSEGQVGWIDTQGNIQQWETPPRIGTIYSIHLQEKKGLWVYSSKGLWLLRMREP